jgi:hypothetical protein
MPIDPQTGLFVDDGTDDFTDYQGTNFGGIDPFGYNANSFLQPTLRPAYSTTKSMFGRQLPMGQPQINQQLTGQKSINAILRDPTTAYEAMVATGQQTMNPNALMGLDASGMPLGSNMWLGGGGGGSGGGNNFGFKPVFTTPTLDRLQGAPDRISQLIMSGVQNNQPGWKIKQDVLNSPEGKAMAGDQMTSGGVMNDIDNATKEWGDKNRNDLLGQFAQMNQQSQQSELQKWMDKNGLINPLQQYTADTLPGDVQPVADMMGAAASNPYSRMAQQASDSARGNYNQLWDIRDQARQSKQNDWATVGAAARNAANVPFNPAMPGTVATGPPVSYNDAVRSGFRSQPGEATGIKSTAPNRPQLSQDQRGAMARLVGNAARVVGRSNSGYTQDQRQQTGAARRAQQQNQAYADEYQRQGQDANNMVRFLVARDVGNQGRTPARDAQRAVINYLRSGGLAV